MNGKITETHQQIVGLKDNGLSYLNISKRLRIPHWRVVALYSWAKEQLETTKEKASK